MNVVASGVGPSATLASGFFYYPEPSSVNEVWDANENLSNAGSSSISWAGEFGDYTLALGGCPNAPALTTNWTGSLSAVSATGSNSECLESTANLPYSGSAYAVTVILVASGTTPGTQAWFATAAETIISTGTFAFAETGGSDFYVGIYAAGQYNEGYTTAITYTVPHLYTFTYNFNVSLGTLAVTMRQDRSSVSLTDTGTPYNVLGVTQGKLLLFAFNLVSGTQNYATASIGWFFIVDKVLDATAISNVENYERARWGTP